MKALLFISAMLLIPFSAQAAAEKKAATLGSTVGAGVPISVEYLKTGREDDAQATKLGQSEVDNSNPCVLKMRRDVAALEKRQELREAVTAVASTFDAPKPKPRLVLHYMHEAMELRFEMWSPQVKMSDGTIEVPEMLKYRKGIFVSDRPGSWQDRLDGEACHVSEDKFEALVDELREADRLKSCIQRKRDLLDMSAKISNYVHNYLPLAWLDEARRRLILQNAPIGDLLREDTTVYRSGNSSFRECQRGLKLLEEEAASSVRVLNEVRDYRKGTDVPDKEIDDLEHSLSGLAK